jgi:hypothetical protein
LPFAIGIANFVGISERSFRCLINREDYFLCWNTTDARRRLSKTVWCHHFPFESGGSAQSRAISSGFRNDPAEGKDADSTEKKIGFHAKIELPAKSLNPAPNKRK